MKSISATLISLNEEAKIARALQSLEGVADEILVVDSGSTDSTVEICRSFKARLINRDWPGFRAQKQFAADQARFDWILSIDCDEALSPTLQEEILTWKRLDSSPVSGYRIPRKTFFLGRWIEHSGWYPDQQLRLFDRTHGRWQGNRLHESVAVSGPIGDLPGILEHYTYDSVDEYLKQLHAFTPLAAADLHDRGRRTTISRLALLPAAAFLKTYFLRQGFRDGLPGLAIAYLTGASVFFKYLKLWEIQKGLSPLPPSVRQSDEA